MHKPLWFLRGPKAGTFEDVDSKEADKLIADGTAQLIDGKTPLLYPENHPHYGMDTPKNNTSPAPKKKVTAKKKYPNKMLKTDDE